MCDPVTITAVATVASTAFGMYQVRQEAKAQKAASAYNTRIMENEAQQIRNQATESENMKRLETARLLSRQRAQLGAANVDLTTGSALQLQEDTLNLGEADALRIRESGNRQYEATMQGAALEKYKGEVAEKQGKLKMVGTLLSGAAKVAGTGIADKWFTPESSINQSPMFTGGEMGLTY